MFHAKAPEREVAMLRYEPQDGWMIQQGEFTVCPYWESSSSYHRRLRQMQIDKARSRKSKQSAITARARQVRNVSVQTDESCLEPDQDGNCIDESDDQGELDSTSRALIENIMENIDLSGNRRRFDATTYDLAWVIYLTSPKTYNILRQLFPLPSKTNLYRQFGSSLATVKDQLTDILQMPKLISEYLSEMRTDYIVGTLSIDAFAFRSFQGMQSGSTDAMQVYNSGFLMVFTPLMADFENRVLHIMPHTSGSYDKDVAAHVCQVIESAQQNGLRFWFKATDGDVGLSAEHKTFFNDYVFRESGDFSGIVERLSNRLESDESFFLPIADPLHVLKNLRAKLLTRTVTVCSYNADDYRCIDMKRVKEILNVQITGLLLRLLICYGPHARKTSHRH